MQQATPAGPPADSLASPLDAPSRQPAASDLGIYLHIPFCRRKCHYCDFNTYLPGSVAATGSPEGSSDPRPDPIPRYVDALLMEISRAPSDAIAGSLFFGGGTPSMLPTGLVSRIVEFVAERLRLPSGAEVTLEANPGDLTPEYLTGLRAAGINRLSIGVQSLDDDKLRRLGRRHDVGTARGAFEAAREAGFANVSLDLMFGLPGQTLDNWRGTLEAALGWRPEHFSLYCLTIEDGTPFAKWTASGRLVVPDDDTAADMYEAAQDLLGTAGYQQYEISNWARRDEVLKSESGAPVRGTCRDDASQYQDDSQSQRDWRGQHNLRYWRNQEYLGFGAGAYSSFRARRFADVRVPADYVRRLEAGTSVVDERESEPIDLPRAMSETMFLGLRLTDEGVGLNTFRARFGRDLLAVYAEAVADLLRLGLVEIAEVNAAGSAIRLTRRGRVLGNEVFQRFLPS